MRLTRDEKLGYELCTSIIDDINKHAARCSSRKNQVVDILTALQTAAMQMEKPFPGFTDMLVKFLREEKGR